MFLFMLKVLTLSYFKLNNFYWQKYKSLKINWALEDEEFTNNSSFYYEFIKNLHKYKLVIYWIKDLDLNLAGSGRTLNSKWDSD